MGNSSQCLRIAVKPGRENDDQTAHNDGNKGCHNQAKDAGGDSSSRSAWRHRDGRAAATTTPSLADSRGLLQDLQSGTGKSEQIRNAANYQRPEQPLPAAEGTGQSRLRKVEDGKTEDEVEHKIPGKPPEKLLRHKLLPPAKAKPPDGQDRHDNDCSNQSQQDDDHNVSPHMYF